jgi:hypothetical protein
MIYREYPCHIHPLREKHHIFPSKIGLYEFFKEQICLCERAFDPYIIYIKKVIKLLNKIPHIIIVFTVFLILWEDPLYAEKS